ncbi:hypothetical protein BKA93DRAFT_779938 [Sparassis latifolia]
MSLFPIRENLAYDATSSWKPCCVTSSSARSPAAKQRSALNFLSRWPPSSKRYLKERPRRSHFD